MAQTKEEKLAYKRKRYAENPEKFKARHRQWIADNPERAKELRNLSYKKTYTTNKYAEGVRKCTLKKKYGITPDFYEMVWEQQKGLCAVCNKPEKTKKRLAVDHCHSTGEVRGLLCMKCNTALGKLNDDATLIEKLLKYIKD